MRERMYLHCAVCILVSVTPRFSKTSQNFSTAAHYLAVTVALSMFFTHLFQNRLTSKNAQPGMHYHTFFHNSDGNISGYIVPHPAM